MRRDRLVGVVMSDVALQMRGPVGGTTDARKVAIGSSVGAVIENYDFIGYGTAAALYFGTAFFPSTDPVMDAVVVRDAGHRLRRATPRRHRRRVPRRQDRPSPRPHRLAAAHGHRHRPHRL